MNYKKCFAGFTMAEVLITIGIIGVVAAMTFPALVMHHRNKALESQFKKYYSIFSQSASAAGYEFSNCNGVYEEDIKKYIYDKLNKLSEKTLAENDKTPMFPAEYKQYTLTGIEADDNLHQNCLIGNHNYVYVWGPNYQAVLNDGSFVGICSHVGVKDMTYESGKSYSNGVFITIDVNGLKGPNRFGYDICSFHLQADTCIVEAGGTHRNLSEDEPGYGVGSSSQFTKLCDFTDRSSTANGFYCAYYAIQDKCPDGSGKSYFNCLPN